MYGWRWGGTSIWPLRKLVFKILTQCMICIGPLGLRSSRVKPIKDYQKPFFFFFLEEDYHKLKYVEGKKIFNWIL